MKIMVALVAAGMLVLAPATATAGGAEVFAVDRTGEVIPAHPCVEEDILITGGSSLFVLHRHVDGSGRVHDDARVIDRGVHGVGVETETEYRVTGVQISRITEDADSFEDYFIAKFNFVSKGPSDNLVALVKFRFRADGDGVEFSERISIECRG